MPIVLIATLDTKGAEIDFVRARLNERGLKTIVIDAGSMGMPTVVHDITRSVVFWHAGTTEKAVSTRGDRGLAVADAARGVAALVKELDAEGRVSGIIAIGGSAGTVIGTSAMRALPFGRPKIMVSTLASGQVRPYVGGSDIMMLHSVADIAGLNRLTRTVLSNAANAMAGMVSGGARGEVRSERSQVISATMFGVTTPCVDRARKALESHGREVLVFHATGIGGQSMEALIRDGLVDGVLDITTTELADEQVGGILSAGPDRLEAAGRRGIPQVVSVGALDMVNFGPQASVPDRLKGRLFHVHNETVTLMRTTPEENQAIGVRMAEILRQSRGPVAVLLPLGGVSALDAPGRPFFDPAANCALFSAIRDGLIGFPNIELIETPDHINDPAFADIAVSTLLRLMSGSSVGAEMPERKGDA